MPNEKYKKLLNINSDTYDPVIDFRNKVVEMRRQQTKYNKKQGNCSMVTCDMLLNQCEWCLCCASLCIVDNETPT